MTVLIDGSAGCVVWLLSVGDIEGFDGALHCTAVMRCADRSRRRRRTTHTTHTLL